MASADAVPIKELQLNYEEEGSVQKFVRKTKEAPFVPIGIAGAILGVAYGFYNYKNRGKMSTSIYLIHLRVAAQGTVVAALTLGVGYSLLRDYVWDHDAYEKKIHDEEQR